MGQTYSVCSHCHKVNKIKIDQSNGRDPICGNCQSVLPLQGWVNETSMDDLQKLIRKSSLPVVVDYWASWCGPCQSFAPTFKEASEKLKGRVVFAKVDTEKYPAAGDFYRIRGIPTIILFKGGKEVSRQSGALPLPMFQNWLESYT